MKTFYDIHTHILNLSHPNLTAYLFRPDLKQQLAQLLKDNRFDLAKLGLGSLILPSLTKNAIHEKLMKGEKALINVIVNCLSFMEVPMEYQFLVLEYFLKTGSPTLLNKQRQLEINGTAYDKIVLCPLVIDFGYKNMSSGIFYGLSPKRPIASQVGDLLYAIKTYYRFNLEVKEKRMHLSKEIPDFQACKHEKLFEIYPFMGLDTRNYTLKEIRGLLYKYFPNFSKSESGEERRARLFAKMGQLDSNMYKSPEEYADVFAGIKLYPQLGFDPYPKDPDELKKVQYLYKFCVKRRIPITTHCSDGGYKIGQYDDLTRPPPTGRWKNVLNEFPELTLNFAHFGSESQSPKRQWRNAIIALTKKHPHVYADISCNEATPAYYNELESLFNPTPKPKFDYPPPDNNPELYTRVLFGSDFSINLLASKVASYNAYLDAFAKAKLSHKDALCSENPARFLFG